VTTAVNWFGITVTSRANFAAVALQVIIMVGFLILGVIALYAGKGNGSLTIKPLFDAATFDAGKVFSATSICIMSFLGFDAVSTLAEEVEGGDRRVAGRAIIAVLVLSAVFFVAITWVLGNLRLELRSRIRRPPSVNWRRGPRGAGCWLVLSRHRRTVERAPMQVGARGLRHGP
jgi:amino acid transporter